MLMLKDVLHNYPTCWNLLNQVEFYHYFLELLAQLLFWISSASSMNHFYMLTVHESGVSLLSSQSLKLAKSAGT